MAFVPALPSVETEVAAGVETDAPTAVEISAAAEIVGAIAVPAAVVPADAVTMIEEELSASLATPSCHNSINEVPAAPEVVEPDESVPLEQSEEPLVINPSEPDMPFGTFWF
ncbi:hypothetical protein [Pseudomonas aeruginosa]|nr:hypothetical protein [Pseudomonas aeruginosa]MCT9633903.1 hypothetical protein [Pseudomonas aeruginosa]